MKHIVKAVEFLANVALIVAATLLSVVLIRSHLHPAPSPSPKEERAVATSPAPRMVQIGDVLNLPGLNWQTGRQTLLLALSTTCHFCTESTPFYRRLSKERGETRIVALLPQDVGEGEGYLKKAGVQVDEVKQISLGEIGLRGTPTVILVDDGGKVVSTWEGILQPERQNEVLSRIRPQTAKN
jgi:hypothetical protein